MQFRPNEEYVDYIKAEGENGTPLQQTLSVLHDREPSIGIIRDSFTKAGYDARTTPPGKDRMWLQIYVDKKLCASIRWLKRKTKR